MGEGRPRREAEAKEIKASIFCSIFFVFHFKFAVFWMQRFQISENGGSGNGGQEGGRGRGYWEGKEREGKCPTILQCNIFPVHLRSSKRIYMYNVYHSCNSW